MRSTSESIHIYLPSEHDRPVTSEYGSERRGTAGQQLWLFTSPSTDARIKWGPEITAKWTLNKKKESIAIPHKHHRVERSFDWDLFIEER